MISELFPQYFHDATAIHSVKNGLCLRADAVICISQNTKSDLARMFGVDPGKISVVHLGITLRLGEHAQWVPALPNDYVLFVGASRTAEFRAVRVKREATRDGT
jgi:glycosyltransferase involved in cell wall biosynthesis